MKLPPSIRALSTSKVLQPSTFKYELRMERGGGNLKEFLRTREFMALQETGQVKAVVSVSRGL